ncbi:DnaJ domain-containing protein [Desulfobulbus oligotrophicus]|uniref:DnaJ domain-containing protein n=1 Tax=Desulfobulbus oligotrophicus TaxID=1909699 RepID=A0A7T6AR54_9BACT|nr:DnaJ domain-containing protein [Desulfobulbus oligotrophicus]QQG66426.1 DnaJ domain-containing protein [Desulfobulbus oligotrophicus]
MEYNFDPSVDYYARLGLSPQAEENVIKAAYRALSQKYHPDKNGGDNSRMQELNEAYAILSTHESKAAYDEARKSFNNTYRGNGFSTENHSNGNHGTGKPDAKATVTAPRWSRFFARIFDLWLEVLVVSLVVGLVAGYIFPSFWAWLEKPGADAVLGIITMPVALVLDAVIFSIFGNTPGKAILGLRILTKDGQVLSFAQYLQRNLSVWVYGLGLGIPIVNLFTMAAQGNRLKKGMPTKYDEQSGYTVQTGDTTWIRRSVFGVSVISLLFLISIFNTIKKGNKEYRHDESLETTTQSKNIDRMIDDIFDTDNKQKTKQNHLDQSKIQNNSGDYSDPEKRSERIINLYNAGDYTEVVKEAESGDFLKNVSNIIGISMYNTGQFKRSLYMFLDAEELYPDDFAIKCNLGDSYLKNGNLSMALCKYIEAQNINPDNEYINNKIRYIESNVDFSSFGYKMRPIDIELKKVEAQSVFNFLEQINYHERITEIKIIYKGNSSKLAGC